MTSHRILLSLTFTLLATACAPKEWPLEGGLEGKSFLESMTKGPKVDSVSDTLLKTARAAEAKGDQKVATQYYQQLADNNPEHLEYQVALADSYRKMGDLDRSLLIYEAIIRKDALYIPAR